MQQEFCLNSLPVSYKIRKCRENKLIEPIERIDRGGKCDGILNGKRGACVMKLKISCSSFGFVHQFRHDTENFSKIINNLSIL